LSKGEPARPVRLSDPASPFHASPLTVADCHLLPIHQLDTATLS
jgi:hypothetical protein